MANINGTSGSDTISGTSLADVIDAGNGNDTVFGRSGDDLLYGRFDNDKILGEAGFDRVSGGMGDDYINGGVGADRLWGDEGSDEIYGGDQDDKLWGGWGDDLIDGGNGNDTLYGNGSTLDPMDENYGDADILFGRSGNDLIIGGYGSDTAFAGVGDDVFEGSSGRDVYTGNAGRDLFKFDFKERTDVQDGFLPFTDANTIITDFVSGTDRLSLTNTFSIVGADEFRDLFDRYSFQDLDTNRNGTFGTGDRAAIVENGSLAIDLGKLPQLSIDIPLTGTITLQDVLTLKPVDVVG